MATVVSIEKNRLAITVLYSVCVIILAFGSVTFMVFFLCFDCSITDACNDGSHWIAF